MAYRAPNTYARFVKTAGAVNNPGASRVMGLIGTGLNYYEVYNESVVKSATTSYDTLLNSNVFEIMNVSTKPVYTGKYTPNNKTYVQNASTGFQLNDGKNITWVTVLGNEPSAEIVTNPNTTFEDASNITVAVNGTKGYLVEDGEWLIEVTYVDSVNGAYRVINNTTKEIVGEYAVSATSIEGIIPGVDLTVKSTNGTLVGDYITVKTVAGKTETDAKAEIVTGEGNSTLVLEEAIEDLKVVNTSTIVDGTFVIRISSIEDPLLTGKGKALTISVAEEVDGVEGEATSYTLATIEDFLDAIPGVNFTFVNGTEFSTSDMVTIETSTKKLGKAPEEGTIYYVSYKYRKADEDYAPKLFTDYDDIVNEYGNYDVTASGVVINSLALGAEIAFTNGVNSIVCVQAKNDSDYEMNKAIDALQRSIPGVNNINTIVPLTDSSAVGAYASVHVGLMSSYEHGKERMAYLGASRTQKIAKSPTALDKTIGMVETAQSYKDERVVFVVPGEITKDIRDLRNGKINERKLPACYPAVAVAALGLVNDPAEPLTNKEIAGFKNLTTFHTDSEKNILAAAGCLVIEQAGSNIKVRHGITTSTADVNSAEITLVQIKDYVIDACRTSTASLYIGNKNRPSVVSDVQYTISSILNQFITKDILISYSGLTVKRSKEDPRQIDVKFEIEAVYPLNYINIDFGFTAI